MSSSSWIRSHLVEVILLAARVCQEIGDDAVQPLRFPGHNVEQATVILIHLRHAREHADRAGNGSQRIADLVRDGRRQPAHRRQAVLHADFALQAANLCQVVENVDVTQIAALRHVQGCNPHPQRLAESVGASKRTSPWRFCDSTVGAGPERAFTGFPADRWGSLQKPLRGGIDQRDAAIESGRDQSAADGVNDVLVQRLQAFQRATGSFS